MDEEHFYRLALSRIPGIGLITAHKIIEGVESVTWLFKHRKEVMDALSGATPLLVKALDCPDVLRACEKEMKFAEDNHISCLISTDTGYPSRLLECNDAPTVLFYRGNADLNRLHVISVVGTRRATNYGRDLCESFVRDLESLIPDALIVSGLAYGIDITAQRACLTHGLDTVAVLAHGLDRIYPSVHRDTAAEMVRHGGLVTEFTSGTNPDRQNFVMRNRIIAGMADATIIVESANKGGALITASIARSYNRECFTFPGRVGDEYSTGCNRMIRLNQAALIESAEDLADAMNWSDTVKAGRRQPVQRELFPTFTEEEQRVLNALSGMDNGMQINSLSQSTDIAVHKLAGILLELEAKGVVRVCAGDYYRMV